MKKAEIKKLDALWARLVKEKAGFKCEYCLEEGRQIAGHSGVWLEAAHIIGRSYRATRWMLNNGMCLCSGCHRAYDEHRPQELRIRNDVVGNHHYEMLCNVKPVDVKTQEYEKIKNSLEMQFNLAMEIKRLGMSLKGIKPNEKSIRNVRPARSRKHAAKRSRTVCK